MDDTQAARLAKVVLRCYPHRRYWGPIAGSSIIGKVVLVWWRDSHPDFHWF